MNTFLIKRKGDGSVTKVMVQSADKLKVFDTAESAMASGSLNDGQLFATPEEDTSSIAVFNKAELGNLNAITSNAVRVLYDLLNARITALENSL